MSIDELQKSIEQFVADRNWGQYHSTKNLILSLVSEVGELCDLFRWLTPEQEKEVMEIPSQAQQVREEIADIFNNLVQIAKRLNIDLVEEGKRKLEKTCKKYPADQWNGQNSSFTKR